LESPIELIFHNVPHFFEVADRVHIHRLGTINPKDYTMSDAVAFMIGTAITFTRQSWSN
tara:strand:+ start:312 stop:488 length:177 start_codon:yes stop_codon:yes gene_type:complete